MKIRGFFHNPIDIGLPLGEIQKNHRATLIITNIW